MGSDSDLETMKDAAKILLEFGVESEISILSTHRVPQETSKYAKEALSKGIKVLIAGAGGAAALAGSLASHTPLPVIGVPIETKSLSGFDSLFSTVSMPPGIPVATVAIGGAKNAGILATQILATSDAKLAQKIEKYKKNIKNEVLLKNTKLHELGWEKYLKQK